MASYIGLVQFTDQGIRGIKDTTTRAAGLIKMAERMGVKTNDIFWTLGQYDAVMVAEAPDDETIAAFAIKISSLGNVKTQMLRAFRAGEMDAILKKV